METRVFWGRCPRKLPVSASRPFFVKDLFGVKWPLTPDVKGIRHEGMAYDIVLVAGKESIILGWFTYAR
jgi:hypothetical protein